MTFISVEFLFLFVATVSAFSACKDSRKRQAVLLIASYIFYAYWDIRFLGLLLLQTYISYRTARQIAHTKEDKRKKIYCACGIGMLVLILGFFKYFNFFVESMLHILQVRFDECNIILPVGISFYTFQAISYMVDVYRGITPVQKQFYKVSLYISFFPQLVAGSIVRANDFLPQLEKEHRIRTDNIADALQIFLFGLFKKVVVADRLAICVDAVFAVSSEYDAVSPCVCCDCLFHADLL